MTRAAWELALDRQTARVEKAVEKATRIIGIQALSGVVMKTPVDTGRARGNWQMEIGTRPGGDVETTDKAGGAVINKGVAKLGAVRPFDTVFLVNNLPYAERLENGWSKQAPRGMVGLTVAEIAAKYAGGIKVDV